MEDQAQNTAIEQRECGRCHGVGTVEFKGFTTDSGKVYPTTVRQCSSCKGAKTFSNFNPHKIIDIITTAHGSKDGKRRFRTAWPAKNDHYKDHNMSRAYFVWRMIRFNSGQDMTMPVTADMVLGADPYKKELDQLAGMLSKHMFGTDTAGLKRWAQAFGYPDKFVDTL